MIDLDKKRKLVEDLLAHLDKSQGGDLGKMIEASKAPKEIKEEVKPEDFGIESAEAEEPKELGDEEVEGIEALSDPEHPEADKPGDNEELSDEELAEMLKKYLA